MTTEATATIAPAPPTTYTKVCPECGCTFTAETKAQVFCCPDHRVAYANLCLSRGKSVVPLLVTWRRHRDTAVGRLALRKLCQIASMYIEEDRDDGRDSAIQVEALEAGHHLCKFDRVENRDKARRLRLERRTRSGELQVATG